MAKLANLYGTGIPEFDITDAQGLQALEAEMAAWRDNRTLQAKQFFDDTEKSINDSIAKIDAQFAAQINATMTEFAQLISEIDIGYIGNGGILAAIQNTLDTVNSQIALLLSQINAALVDPLASDWKPENVISKTIDLIKKLYAG